MSEFKIDESQKDKEARAAEAKRRALSNLPRTFMSPAYVQEEERGLFTMWRDVLVETDKPDGVGGFYREKMGKRIGPVMILRVAKEGEEVDFTTSRSDGTVLLLTKVKRENQDFDPNSIPKNT